jgi:hypothetical protein
MSEYENVLSAHVGIAKKYFLEVSGDRKVCSEGRGEYALRLDKYDKFVILIPNGIQRAHIA